MSRPIELQTYTQSMPQQHQCRHVSISLAYKTAQADARMIYVRLESKLSRTAGPLSEPCNVNPTTYERSVDGSLRLHRINGVLAFEEKGEMPPFGRLKEPVSEIQHQPFSKGAGTFHIA